MEGGKGIKLNDKAYFATEANYTLNQHWSFNLNANINGSGTPVKAINKGVYTKDIGFSTTYSYSDIFQAGLGGGVMKFDDGNLRKEANFLIEKRCGRLATDINGVLVKNLACLMKSGVKRIFTTAVLNSTISEI